MHTSPVITIPDHIQVWTLTHFKQTGKFYGEEYWVLPSNLYPWDMLNFVKQQLKKDHSISVRNPTQFYQTITPTFEQYSPSHTGAPHLILNHDLNLTTFQSKDPKIWPQIVNSLQDWYGRYQPDSGLDALIADILQGKYQPWEYPTKD
jgi:hypothetical protein